MEHQTLMPSPLDSPYSHIPSSERITIQARVSREDLYYFRRLFAYNHGLLDNVLAHLFKTFIEELHARQLDPNNPDHCSFGKSPDAYALVESVLAVIQRRSPRIPVDGTPSPRNDQRTTGGLHQTLRHLEEQCANTPRRDTKDVGSGEEVWKVEEILRRLSESGDDFIGGVAD